MFSAFLLFAFLVMSAMSFMLMFQPASFSSKSSFLNSSFIFSIASSAFLRSSVGIPIAVSLFSSAIGKVGSSRYL